jgi:hypothetical protein
MVAQVVDALQLCFVGLPPYAGYHGGVHGSLMDQSAKV